MLRRGSWNNNPQNCRSAYRNNNASDNRNDNIGFRVVVHFRKAWSLSSGIPAFTDAGRATTKVLALFLVRRLWPVGRSGGRTHAVGPGGSGRPFGFECPARPLLCPWVQLAAWRFQGNASHVRSSTTGPMESAESLVAVRYNEAGRDRSESVSQ